MIFKTVFILLISYGIRDIRKPVACQYLFYWSSTLYAIEGRLLPTLFWRSTPVCSNILEPFYYLVTEINNLQYLFSLYNLSRLKLATLLSLSLFLQGTNQLKSN